jgi:hypothetical protein
MKTIEEKAKAYDEAIKRAKEFVSKDNVEVTEYIFPELAESEDERIRKEMIEILKKEAHDFPSSVIAEKSNSWIAWLEKQGEQKLEMKTPEESLGIDSETYNKIVDECVYGEQKPKFRVGDTIKCKYDDRQFTIKSVDLDKGTYTYTQEGCGNDIDYADEEFELVEQKPADKVEPRFKVGDKIYLKPEHRMPDDDTPIANTVFEIRAIDDKHYKFDGSYIFIEDQDKYELVEQKQEWSEEDESILQGIWDEILANKHNAKEYEWKTYDKFLNWLNFLKDRVGCEVNCTTTREWKPSDEQIMALRWVLNHIPYDSHKEEISGLLEQLKKLREE